MTGRLIQYEDLLVRLTGGDGGRLLAQVTIGHRLRSHEVVLPPDYFDPSRIDELACRSPGEVGETLFRALFAGDALGRLRAVLTRAQMRERRGVRVRLSFDLTDPVAARAARLPWELLRDPETGDHLSGNPLTPVVRFLETRDARAGARAVAPLTVLVVHAAPPGQIAPDRDEELRQLTEALGGRRVEVREVTARTWDELREHLLETDARCDVVHFIGHGDLGFDGEGGLWFEGTGGRPEAVTGRQLGEILRRRPTIRLVVLNACRTAAQPEEAGADPYAGVAHALIRAGVPAVVAMCRPIADRAAIRFSRTFYRCLARGERIETAMAQARTALRDPRFGDLAWSVPALFLQVLEGDLFDLRPPPRWPRVRGWLSAKRWPLAALLVLLAGLAVVPFLPRRQVFGSGANPPECPSPEGFDVAMVLVEPEEHYTPGTIDVGGRAEPLPEPFCLGRYEVTNDLYGRVMGADDELVRGLDPDLPVQGVTRSQADVFLKGFDELNGGRGFRLPAGAEWVTAARAGTETPFFFGEYPERMARYANCGKTGGPVAVGTLDPNPLGLYDMLGNVTEWVAETTIEEVRGDERLRGIRWGGSWKVVLTSCNSDEPSIILPDTDMADAGFRLALDPVPPD